MRHKHIYKVMSPRLVCAICDSEKGIEARIEELKKSEAFLRELWKYRNEDGWEDGWCSLSFPGSIVKEIDELLG